MPTARTTATLSRYQYMSRCNYCSHRQLKKLAKDKGMKLTIIRETEYALGGVNVFMSPPEITREYLKTLVRGTPEREKYLVAWYMELTDHCCC